MTASLVTRQEDRAGGSPGSCDPAGGATQNPAGVGSPGGRSSTAPGRAPRGLPVRGPHPGAVAASKQGKASPVPQVWGGFPPRVGPGEAPAGPHRREALRVRPSCRALTSRAPAVPQQREAPCVSAVRSGLQPELQPRSAPAGPHRGQATGGRCGRYGCLPRAARGAGRTARGPSLKVAPAPQLRCRRSPPRPHPPPALTAPGPPRETSAN